MFQFANGFLTARRAPLMASVLTAGVIVAGSCALYAQADAQTPPPPDRPDGMHHRGPGVERQLGELTHVLTLNESQQAQVKTLLTAQREQMEALRRPQAESDVEQPRPNREQMEQIHQATDAKIAALLNDDQKAKFAAWQKQRQAMMERHRGPDGQEPPPPPQP
jgi:Spy/CpxP family protein refolding chaperone